MDNIIKQLYQRANNKYQETYIRNLVVVNNNYLKIGFEEDGLKVKEYLKRKANDR